MTDLHAHVEQFVARWEPNHPRHRLAFIDDLRQLLEAYGKAALEHQSLPDTEHAHGEDPV